MSKMLLISTVDDFSESASFYQLSEDYKLEADFYVNPEMVSFNKKVTVSYKKYVSFGYITFTFVLDYC